MAVHIFIDLENLVKSLERYIVAPSEFFDKLDLFIRNMFPMRESIYMRAYASWGLHSTIVNYLHMKGVDVVYAYAAKRGENKAVKNLADMKIAVDVFDSLMEHPEVDTYVLVTGDLDFLPLVFLLKKYGKKVVIISDEMALAGPLASASDLVFTYKDVDPDIKSILQIQEQVDMTSLIEVTLKLAYMAEEMGYQLSPSILKELLALHFGSFQEREWGFPNFKAFVDMLERHGYVEFTDRAKMLLRLTPLGKETAGAPYIPEEDYQLAKQLCEKDHLKGGKLIAKLRKLSGKQGIKGGKAYWAYIVKMAGCDVEEGEESDETSEEADKKF